MTDSSLSLIMLILINTVFVTVKSCAGYCRNTYRIVVISSILPVKNYSTLNEFTAVIEQWYHGSVTV